MMVMRSDQGVQVAGPYEIADDDQVALTDAVGTFMVILLGEPTPQRVAKASEEIVQSNQGRRR